MECCSMHLCIFAQFISQDPLACFPFSSLLNKNCALRYLLTPVLPKWACFNWLQWWREESPVGNEPTLQISFFSVFWKVGRGMSWQRCRRHPLNSVVLSVMSVLVRLSTQHLESSGKASDSLTPTDSPPSCIFLSLTGITLFSFYFLGL